MTKRLKRAFAAIVTLSVLLLQPAHASGPSNSNGGFDVADPWPDRMSPTDMAIGSAHARVTLIFYVSPTCPQCAIFQDQAGARLKSDYVDAGRVRFAFREYPVGIQDVSIAMFQVARCRGASAEVYTDRLVRLMQASQEMTRDYNAVEIRRLVTFAQAFDLTADQVNRCIDDAAGRRRAFWSMGYAIGNYQISGAPTFVLDGVVLNVHSTAELFAAIDAELQQSR